MGGTTLSADNGLHKFRTDQSAMTLLLRELLRCGMEMRAAVGAATIVFIVAILMKALHPCKCNVYNGTAGIN